MTDRDKVSTSVGAVILPAFSRYHAQDRFRHINNIVVKTFRYISLISVPPVIFIILFSDRILDILYSSTFAVAGPAFAILAVFFLLNSLFIPFKNVLLGVNKPAALAKISIFTVGANIILNIWLIPRSSPLAGIGIYGTAGAAMATAMSAVITLVLSAIAARNYMTERRAFEPFAYHLVAGVAMFVVLFFIDFFFPLSRWFHAAIYGMIGLGVYVGFLSLAGEWRSRDTRFFLDTFNVRKMWRYVTSEFRRKKR